MTERGAWSSWQPKFTRSDTTLAPMTGTGLGNLTVHGNGEIGSDQRYFQGILGIDEQLLCVAEDFGVEIFLWVSSLLVAWEDRISAL
jgi:hypothetical protein